MTLSTVHLILFLSPLYMVSQVIDTIANWDGINVEWTVYAQSGQTVENPFPSAINPSANCFEVVTTSGEYDLIYTDFQEPVNFTQFPFYRIKILAPPTGGNVLLKFENSDNTSWMEIEKTPVPGQWDDLEFDFSGTISDNFTRMVIFFDFLGSNEDKHWFLDDVLRISGESPNLTSNLPIVIINTNGNPIPDEPKIDGMMSIIDNSYGNLNNQNDPPNDYYGHIGIEVRGQSSQMFPKKSYGFETRNEDGSNLNVSLLGMPEENDWILYAPYSDKSMLRNFITFYMGSKLDTYCSRMAYCEVIENDNYKGVYILMEKIKRDQNRVDIATLKSVDTSGIELSGGYIVKVDKIDDDFVYGIDGWFSNPTPPYPNAMNITFQFYYPEADDIVSQQRNYIIDYITNAENALTGPNYADPDIGYNKYLNTGSFVDHMILCEISKEVDNYRYSTFFYKEKDNDGGKLHAGPAWDFNLGYSNVDYWPPGIDYTGWQYTMVEPVEWSIMFWWKRLMEDPYFTKLLNTRWKGLREHELNDINLNHAIDSVVSYIYEAQQRNYERWPILGEYVWPNYNWEDNDYDDEVNFFRTWFFNRISWMDANIPGFQIFPEAHLSGNLPELSLSLEQDYFNRTDLESEDFLLNASSSLNIDSAIFENASSAKLVIKGDIPDSTNISVTIKAGILNGFTDLTSNSINVGVDGILFENYGKPIVHTAPNAILINCDQPELLGNNVEIFTITGQMVGKFVIRSQTVNRVSLNLERGIYLCRYSFNGVYITQRFVFGN